MTITISRPWWPVSGIILKCPTEVVCVWSPGTQNIWFRKFALGRHLFTQLIWLQFFFLNKRKYLENHPMYKWMCLTTSDSWDDPSTRCCVSQTEPIFIEWTRIAWKSLRSHRDNFSNHFEHVNNTAIVWVFMKSRSHIQTTWYMLILKGTKQQHVPWM